MLGEEDLEEDDYDPFAAFKPAEAQESYSSYQPARYQPQTLGGGPGTKTRPSEAPLFFPLCLDDESDELLNSLNLSAEQKARLEERSWTAGSGRRFNKLGSRCVGREAQTKGKVVV